MVGHAATIRPVRPTFYAQPNGACAPPTLGLGDTLRCGPLNRLAWRFVGAYMDGVYRPIVAAILRRHGLRSDAACTDPQVRELPSNLARARLKCQQSAAG